MPTFRFIRGVSEFSFQIADEEDLKTMKGEDWVEVQEHITFDDTLRNALFESVPNEILPNPFTEPIAHILLRKELLESN